MRCAPILLVVLVACGCFGVEQPPEEAPLQAVLVEVPPAKEGGRGPFVWRVSATEAGRSTDLRLTQAMVDRARVHWWRKGSDGALIEGAMAVRADPYTDDDRVHDVLLPMPVTFAAFGFNRLRNAEDGSLKPGSYDLTLLIGYGRKGRGLAALPVTLEVPGDAVVGASAWNGLSFDEAQLRRHPDWALGFVDADALTTARAFEVEWRELGDGLVPGIPRQQAWEAARLEWVRLPTEGDDKLGTTVFSPWQAGLAEPLVCAKAHPGAQVEETPLTPRLIDPQSAFKDPVHGKAIPGRYWVRAALCWTTPMGKGDGRHLHLARTPFVLVTLRGPEPAPAVDP